MLVERERLHCLPSHSLITVDSFRLCQTKFLKKFHLTSMIVSWELVECFSRFFFIICFRDGRTMAKLCQTRKWARTRRTIYDLETIFIFYASSLFGWFNSCGLLLFLVFSSVCSTIYNQYSHVWEKEALPSFQEVHKKNFTAAIKLRADFLSSPPSLAVLFLLSPSWGIFVDKQTRGFLRIPHW